MSNTRKRRAKSGIAKVMEALALMTAQSTTMI